MADVIIACVRQGSRLDVAERLVPTARRLAPPQLPVREPMVVSSAGVTGAVANPTPDGVRVHASGDGAAARGAVCLGGLFGAAGAWWETASAAPDGTYALVRWDTHALELVADICASRTFWYSFTGDLFVASTSQRALVTVLGGFDLLPEAVACFLASGTLGPEVSWDARIKRVVPDSRVSLDRDAWRLAVIDTPADFTPADGDGDAHVARLRAAIGDTCGALNIDLDRWVLPLSGGCDSRTLLAFLVENGLRPRCVTWTTRASLRKPLSDASIARVISKRYRVDHEFLFLDERQDLESSVSRFVAANAGRNDEIAGYLDGFAMWRVLAERGIHGIIRGDESFGPRGRPMATESSRRQVGGARPSDYPEGHVIRSLGLPEPTWPARLDPTPGEDVRDYRARMSQQGFVPIILAGLNTPKARYLEIVNPLLSRRILSVVRSLPTAMRHHARAFAQIVDGLDRPIPYARSSSTPSFGALFASPEFAELAVRDLTSPAMERVLPGDGALRVLAALALPPAARGGLKPSVKKVLKKGGFLLPTRLNDRVGPRYTGPNHLSPARLAWRAVLASRTIGLLEEDAGVFAADDPMSR